MMMLSPPLLAPSPLRSSRLLLPLLLALTFSSSGAFAAGENTEEKEVSAENKAAARDLAVEGIGLAQADKCEEALPKLQRARRLYYAPTIVTWIGDCQIRLGQLVQGTETLNQVAREKLTPDAPDAFHAAQTKAQELISETRPKIAKLTIEIQGESHDLSSLEGLEVFIDDAPLSSALIGAARPTDPGDHVIRVSAPGYVSKTQSITLTEGEKETLSIELEAAPLEATAARPPSAPPSENQEAEPETADGGTRRTIAWTLVGGGGAFIAGGAVTGLLALNKKSQLECDADKNCDESQNDTLKSARTQAALSTIFFGVGAAALTSGIVLLVTGNEQGPEAAIGSTVIRPEIGWASLGLSGTF